MDDGTLATRPHVRVLEAWRDGWRRVFSAPVLLVGVVIAMALASGWEWIARGPSTWAPGAIAAKVSWLFWNEPASFGGLAPSPVGGSTVRSFLTGFALPPGDRLWPLAGASVSAVLWMFLVGGAIDRLARDRGVGPYAFFGASGAAFGRLLRLGIVLGGLDWILFRWPIPIPAALNVNLAWRDGVTMPAFLGWLVVLAIAFVGDYARVRLIVEDRRSAFGSLAASERFILRRPVRSTALLFLGLVTITVSLTIWSWVQPVMASAGVWASTLWLWVGLAIHVVGRLGLMAGEIAFFQGELAHAGYTARPAPRWPDSPAVEAILNLEKESRTGPSSALPL